MEGFSLTVALAEGSANVITWIYRRTVRPLGANTLVIQRQPNAAREGAGAPFIDGDLQGIYAQGGVAVQNCNLTVGDPFYRSVGGKGKRRNDVKLLPLMHPAGGGLLIEDSNIDLSSQKGTENNKRHTPVSGCNRKS